MDSVLWLDLKGKERESEPHLPKKPCVGKPIEGLTNKHSNILFQTTQICSFQW